MRRISLAGLLILVLPLVASPCFAQSTAGVASWQIPPDPRTEGMGRAYATLVRSPFAAYSNPGGLGFATGLQAAFSRAQLVPDLADDVYHTYGSVLFGWEVLRGAVPVTVTVNFNATDLSYGTSIATVPGNPDPVGEYDSYEHTFGMALAASVGGVLGVGVGAKGVLVKLAPELLEGEGRGETTAHDFGFLLRSPDLVRLLGGSPDGAAEARLLAGASWLNRGRHIALAGSRSADPTPENRRLSVGADLAFFPAERLFENSASQVADWLRDEHLITISGAVGNEKSLLDPPFRPSGAPPYDPYVDYYGAELGILGLLALRLGHIDDDEGKIFGKMWGVGVSFFGGYGGIDFASIPQFEELDRVKKWSVWINLPLDPGFPRD